MTTDDQDPNSHAISDDLRRWLTEAVAAGASDLHLIVGYPPVLRLHGDLKPLDQAPLETAALHNDLSSLCRDPLRDRLAAHKNVDFSLELEIDGRRQRFR